MEKVKITQEQAVMFENHRNNFELLMQKRITENCLTRIDEIAVEDVVKAFIDGYEVEPEYRVGDWVTNKTTMDTIEIDAPNADFLNKNYSHGKHFRHATPEEIEKEKERRWWFKHDRDVWEIRQGDVLMATRRHIFEVTADPKSHEFGVYTGNDEFDFEIEECKDENWKVICFRDDRKDV